MNLMVCKSSMQQSIITTLASFGLSMMLTSMSQASLTYYELPPEPTTSIVTPTPNLENDPPVTVPVIKPQTNSSLTKVPNGQEYYTIPTKPDEYEPVPEAEPIPTSNQPDIIPFPTQPLDAPASRVKAEKNLSQVTKNPIKTTDYNKNSQKITEKAEIKKEPAKPVAVVQESKQVPTATKTVSIVKKTNLKFANFPATVYKGKRVTPKIVTLKNLNSFYVEALHGAKGEKQFIDTLNKTKPNYAGHYVITSFTCGLNCTASVAYDVKTGEFMELGGGFADCPATDYNPRQKASITHQANSRLLIVIGSSSTGSCIAGYFEEKNGNVTLISQKNLMNYVDASKR